jgi:hypothetical protein
MVLIDVSLLKVWIEKAIRINVRDLHLHMYHKSVWRFESKERLDEACVLCKVRHLQLWFVETEL